MNDVALESATAELARTLEALREATTTDDLHRIANKLRGLAITIEGAA